MIDNPRTGIVTLCSDFGLGDSYVGAMKGAVLSAFPQATLVDITHDVPAQNIDRAGQILASACPHYPVGTVHLAVVDPGVGTSRNGVVIVSGGHLFVGPDNGLFGPVVSLLGGYTAYVIDNPSVMAQVLSATFHGRDVFGPVAGHLAAGLDPTDVGPILTALKGATSQPTVERSDGKVTGTVVSVDRFGNLITNIGAVDLPPGPLAIRAAGAVISGLVSTYGDAPSDARLVALIGSDGILELATPGGSAANTLRKGIGLCVEVEAQ